MQNVKANPELLKNKTLEDIKYQYREKLVNSLRESLENLREDFSDKNKTEIKEKIEKISASKVLIDFKTEKELFDTPKEKEVFERTNSRAEYEENLEKLSLGIEETNKEVADSLRDGFKKLDFERLF